MRPHPKMIPLQGGIRNLRVELSEQGWMVWLNANGDWTIGTFLLFDQLNKKIERVTWHPDGSETRIEL